MHSAVDAEMARLRPHWLVIGGAIPAGGVLDPHRIAAHADENGAKLCLDSPGAVVAHWLTAGVAPHLVSPNVAELQDITGHSIRTMGDAIDGAARLLDLGVDTALVSLGEQGALLMTADQRIWARAISADVVNTTGAGDAALAGLISGWGGGGETEGLERALATAVRWGSAAVGNIAPTISPREIAPAPVEIDDPDRAMRLR